MMGIRKGKRSWEHKQIKQPLKKIAILLVVILAGRLCLAQVPSFIIRGDYSAVDSLEKASIAEGNIRQRINAHNHLGAFYEGVSNYKNALEHLYAAERMNPGSFKEEKIFTCNYLGYVYWHKSEYNMALYYHHKALSLAVDTSLSRSPLAFTYLMLGGDHYDLGDYVKTSEYYFKSLQLYEQLNDPAGQIMAHNRLSKLYYKLKDFQRAKQHTAKAQSLNRNVNYVREIAISFNSLGNVYIETGVTDSALHYFKNTLFYFKKCGDVIGQAIACINLGDTYFQLYEKTKADPDLEEAYNYYQMSYMLNKKVDNKFGIIYGLWGMSDIDMSRNAPDAALQNYRKALDQARVIKAKSEEYNLYWKMYKVFDQKGNKDSSFHYLKGYVELKNSMENEEQTKALLRQESKYEITKKIDEKNAELKKDRLIEEEKSKRKNYLILAVILIMIVLAYAVFISVKRLRTIESQNKLINSINNTLTVQKTEIMDSITYARRIQEAILPSVKDLNQNLHDGFLLYSPKDIIAGDFYWMEKAGDQVLIAVADCTGHGVPGALVSVVCSNALNRSLLEFGIKEPGKILDKTRELVLETFSRSDKDVKDGMDISLISIDAKTKKIKWAGANNPIWYTNNGEIAEIVANKQSIGKTEHPVPFTTHELQLKKNDCIYLFTDGYADQFGGKKGKKFKYKPLKGLLEKNSTLPMQEQKHLLEQTLREWKGELEQVDDICIIGVRIG